MKKINFILLVTVALFSAGCNFVRSNNQVQKSEVAAVSQETTMSTQETETNVLLKTTLGDIVIALSNETPQHRDNFIKLVNEKFYDGVLFHRIIREFMIQTGDPDSKTAVKGQPLGSGGQNYTISAEFVPALIHKRGAVAAARMGDHVNPQKASSGSQFYIVDGRTYSLDMLRGMNRNWTPEQMEAYTTIGGAPHLDGNYTVFGYVISGMEVVDKIAQQTKDQNDRPLEDIKIIEAKIIKTLNASKSKSSKTN